MRNRIIQHLKVFKRTILDIPRLLWGFVIFSIKKTTPKSAHQSLINLFCLTGGYSNSVLAYPMTLIHKPFKMKSTQGVLGDLSQQDIQRINKKLDHDGYYIFKEKLPQEICQKLLEVAYTQPAMIRGDTIKKTRREIYSPQNLQAVRYDYDQQMLIDNIEVQKLLTDQSIIAIAQSYLRSKPILDVIGMWWHTAYQKEPDSSSAQFFHFDMDRIRWLKFFIYLTDVNMENGPHAFVKGSHRIRGIPKQLRSQGYARLLDDEIYSIYKKEDIIYPLGPSGTIIAEDTRGLHKGQHVICGDRLVLQIQFSNHLFGAEYPKIKFTSPSDKLNEFIKIYPRIYSNYI